LSTYFDSVLTIGSKNLWGTITEVNGAKQLLDSNCSSKYLNNTIINTTLQALGCIWTNLRKQMNYTENKQVPWHTSSIDIAYNRT